ncbi:hypothetical protein IAQ61_006092 [Plenodomus lingam]|uniref:uncharacterized protein n=1 Tax=Leptosphaeria maculans TaxID=5022 RepID=UPI003322997D|nr:hypothetical protein IAQ61_006092 [Plenodomus lingam]
MAKIQDVTRWLLLTTSTLVRRKLSHRVFSCPDKDFGRSIRQQVGRHDDHIRVRTSSKIRSKIRSKKHGRTGATWKGRKVMPAVNIEGNPAGS